MLDIVERDSVVNLPTQVRDLIVKRIKSGHYAPKKKLDSIRKLSDELGVSRVTIIEAMKLLERDNFIQRIPAKGTFVAGDAEHVLKTIRIILPFPEESMSPEALGDLENWSGVSAVYHGMVDEAKRQHAEISFEHFDEAEKSLEISRQLRRTEQYDGAVFIGLQLENLREHFVAGRKFCAAVVPPVSMSNYPGLSTVTLNLDNAYTDLMQLAVKRGYKRVMYLIRSKVTGRDKENNDNKIAALRKSAEAAGIELAENPVIMPKSNDGALSILSELDFKRQGRDDLFFCCYTEMVPLLYRYAADNNLKIGDNFGVTGHAGGLTFSNLYPEFTYVKIDYRSIGCEVCRLVVEGIRSGTRESKHKFLDSNILVTGKSI